MGSKLPLDLVNPQNIFQLTKETRHLFLPVCQKITHSPVDWDHIIAYNYAKSRSKLKGNNVNWKFVEGTHLLGNFAGIDSRANRVLQDKPPSEKFKTPGGYLDSSFIITEHGLRQTEIEECLLIEALLSKRKVDEAGIKLKEFAQACTLKIWSEVLTVVGNPPNKV